MGMRRKRHPLAAGAGRGPAAVLVSIGAVASTSGASPGAAKAHRLAAQPNIIVIESDDQPTIAFNHHAMPKTFRRVVDHGTVFSQMVATPPLCCPSRAAFMTGDYPHNSGVWSNKPGYRDLEGKGDVLPVWLHRAGYRTALEGKFLNGYGSFAGDKPPPGWDHVMRPIDPYRYSEHRSGATADTCGFPRTATSLTPRPMTRWDTSVPTSAPSSRSSCGTRRRRRTTGRPQPRPAITGTQSRTRPTTSVSPTLRFRSPPTTTSLTSPTSRRDCSGLR